MSYNDEAAKACNKPRIIVDLYDGVTHHYYSQSALYFGSSYCYGRLLGVTPISLIAAEDGIAIPSCMIQLADPDGAISDLGVDLDWTVTVYMTFIGLTIGNGKSYEFSVEKIPTSYKGEISIRCVSTYSNNVGRLRLPTIIASDVAAFSTLTDIFDLIGLTYPIYFGRAEKLDLDPIYYDGIYTYYPFAISAADATNPYTNTNFKVYLKGRDGKTWVDLPRRWVHDVGSYFTLWDIDTETITRSGESTNWRLHFLQLGAVGFEWLGITNDTKVRLDFVTNAPGSARADGEDAKTTTIVDVAKQLCDSYLSDISEGNVGTAGYDSTALLTARDIAEDYGLGAALSISAATDSVRLFGNLLINSIPWWVTSDGKLSINLFAETDYTEMQAGYSSYDSISDWQHAESVSRPSVDMLNEVTVYAQQLVDTNAQLSSVQRAITFSNPNLEKSSSYLLGWMRLQKRRSLAAARRFGISGPLYLSQYSVSDFLLWAEEASSFDDDPILVEQFEFDLVANKSKLICQSIKSWTGTDGHVLKDESTYERSLGGVTASLTATSTTVDLSGSVTAAVDDIVEFNTEDNHFCAVITVAPNDPGGGWEMEIDTAAPATEAAISDWRITQDAPTYSDKSSFLCDTDDEFSDSDAGNTMLFR